MTPAVLRRLLGARWRLSEGRTGSGMALALVSLAATMLAPPPLAAQSLLQSLFGFGAPPPSRPAAPLQNYPLRSGLHHYAPFAGRDSDSSRFDGGSYRTLCVRMCDGFYFPISHGVSRAAFTRDARVCQTSCGAEARLFYQGTNDTGTDGLVDLTGRAYSQIPNAFRYRKSLVAGCACRPAPWSEAELARHRRYAAAETGRSSASGDPLRAAPAEVTAAAALGAAGIAPSTRIAPMERPAPAPNSTESPRNEGLPAEATPAPASSRLDVARPGAVIQPRPASSAASGGSAPRSPQRQVAATKAPVRSASAPAAPSKPYYSHDLGRFVFPGESRLR